MPPLIPGAVSAATEDDLRSSIAQAGEGDVNISVAPGAHIKLASELECSSNITVRIVSSGEGATLDGQGRSRLFSLKGGCSLTLRGLALVNGRAEHGGALHAQGAGDIELIDATIKGCSATHVRRSA